MRALVTEFLIPYYGDPAYLLAAVRSIQALEDTDWTLTIVEDCYPDGPGRAAAGRRVGR